LRDSQKLALRAQTVWLSDASFRRATTFRAYSLTACPGSTTAFSCNVFEKLYIERQISKEQQLYVCQFDYPRKEAQGD